MFNAWGQTGGHTFLPEDPSSKKSADAAREYTRISTVDDAEAIANAAGLSVQDIRTIKRNIFYNKHQLYDGYGFFAPDYDMAVAWKRMEEGKPLRRDLILLEHGLLESQLEKE